VTVVAQHRVVLTFDTQRVRLACDCGWAWSRRRDPAGPGEDLPVRPSAELLVAAQASAERHLRRAT